MTRAPLLSPALVVVALVIGVAGAELGLRRLAGTIADRRLTAAVGADVRVSVRGLFAGLRLLTGRAHEVRAHGMDVPVRGGDARIRRLEVRLEDVDLSLTDSTLRAVRGDFTATIADGELAALAGVPTIVGSIRATEGGVELVTRAGLAVAATVTAEDGDLLVRPANPVADMSRFRLRFALGELPGGATLREVECRDGELVVRGELDGARLTP